MTPILYILRTENDAPNQEAFGLDAAVGCARRMSHGSPVNIFRGRDLVAFTQDGNTFGIGFGASADERAEMAHIVRG